ncbi:EcsC family protein [Deinococcus sp.]|uniref:EcsC family protein n=1 Tax=Deinococcus sp. TaxID=47478 RepID=UPI0025BDEF62|nr:EcsC family protein [Deinococcus sp.]
MTQRTDPIKEKEYEKRARQEIHDWENKPLTLLQEAGEKVSQGVEKAGAVIGRIVPSRVSKAVTGGIENTLHGFGTAMGKTINPASIETQVSANWDDANCCCELEARDQLARKSANIHITVATAEGAALGAGGIATTLVDIPAFVALSLRAIADIALIYGYDPRKDEERHYLFTVLAISLSAGAKAKQEVMLTLKALEKEFRRGTWKGANEIIAKFVGREAFDLKKFAKRLGIELTKRKAAQIVPVVGAAVGGAMNGTMLYQITETAQMVYRRRWLADHRGLSTVDAADD